MLTDYPQQFTRRDLKPVALLVVSLFTVSFVKPLFTTIDTAIIKSSRPVVFCEKSVLTNFAKLARKHLRYRVSFFWHRCFLITPFLKNPSDGCFCIDTRSVPPRPFIFSKTMSHIFSGRVSSQLKPLARSQKPIFNPVKHLQWSFFFENS